MLMVDNLYERLCLPSIIGRYKDRGIPLDALVRGMLAYKLGDDFSASCRRMAKRVGGSGALINNKIFAYFESRK